MTRPSIFSSLSYDEARAVAIRSDRVLLVDATAAWCQPCRVMDKVTWADPAVVAWIEANAIAVQIDVDEEAGLASSLRVQSMPTVIAYRGGEEIARIVGLAQPARLVPWLESVREGRPDPLAVPDASDAKGRLEHARSLLQKAQFSEALHEYVWLWEHVVEADPAMTGVRISFLAGEIAQLVKSYEPARLAFSEIRDRHTENASSCAVSESVLDWVVLNGVLGEDERSIAWSGRPEARALLRERRGHVMRLQIVNALRARGRWAEVPALYDDPMSTLRGHYAIVTETQKIELPVEMATMREEIDANVTKHFAYEAAALRTELMAAGRTEDAEKILAEARRLAPGADLESALDELAKRAGIGSAS